MERKNLTARFIESRKAAPSGQRDEYPDAQVPGLRLRVTDTGHKSFVLLTRYPQNLRKEGNNPTRRALGDFVPSATDGPVAADSGVVGIAPGPVQLAQARARARLWLDLIARGKDPAIEAQRERASQQVRQANSFGAVAADFLDRYAKNIAKSLEAKKIVEQEFVNRWRDRPIIEILPQEASAAIRAIAKRGAPYQAFNAYGYLRRLFTWAIGSGEYGITSSPLDHLNPSDVIGSKREARTRVLSDDELRVVWAATDRMLYPYGPLVRLLILTGQRLREVANMSWSEVDLAKKLWTIPAGRMKGDRSHEVPLADQALAILEELDEMRRKPPVSKKNSRTLKAKEILPLWDKGDYIFSTTRGAKFVNGFSKAKARLDGFVAKIRAEERTGDEQAKPEKKDKLAPFVIHDLRRSVRTHLSALPVQDMVRELVIAHAKRGLHKVYDQHSYRDEKRQCLDLWEKRLVGIVKPKAAGVAYLGKEREKRGLPR